MADFTEIIQEINTNLPDNNTQSITAAKLRTTLIDLTNTIETQQGNFENVVNATISNNIVDNLTSEDTDKSLSANQGYILGTIVGTVVSEVKGSGNLVSRRVDNILPNHTYRVYVQNPTINRSDIPTSSSSDILLTVAYYDTQNNPVYYFTIPETYNFRLQDYYDFTAKSDCTYVNIAMKANNGEKQVFIISDITDEMKHFGNVNKNVRIYNNVKINSYNSTSLTNDTNCMVVSLNISEGDIIDIHSGGTASSQTNVGCFQFWDTTTRLAGYSHNTNGSARTETAPTGTKMLFVTFRKNIGAGFIRVNGEFVYYNAPIILPEEKFTDDEAISEISKFNIGGVKWNCFTDNNHYAFSLIRFSKLVNSISFDYVLPPTFTVFEQIAGIYNSFTANVNTLYGNNPSYKYVMADGSKLNYVIAIIKKSDNSTITEDELKDCYIKFYDSENSESLYFETIKEDGVVEVGGVFGAYITKTTSELTAWGNIVNDYYPSYPTPNTIRARSNRLYFEKKDEQKTFFIKKPSTLSLTTVFISDDDKPVLCSNISNIGSSYNYNYNSDTGILSIRTYNANNIGFTFTKGGEEITQEEVNAIKVWHYVGTREMAERLQNRANPWFGKTYAALGDSITYGYIPRNSPGWNNGNGRLRSYARIAAGNLGMNFYNYGISGNFLSHNSSGTGMCERYVDMVDTADLITFMGGTNDVRNNVQLGTFADRGTTTYYGALHTLIQGLYTKYIASVDTSVGCKKQIVALTPIKLLDKSKSSLANTIENNANVLYQWDGWIDAVKEVAAFYSIPVFDAYNLSGINPHLDRTLHGFDGDYTGYYNPYITDGTHPTVEGQQIFGDNFTGFLKSLK